MLDVDDGCCAHPGLPARATRLFASRNGGPRHVGWKDRGSASIWVLTVTALVLLAGALTMTITAVGAGRGRAAAAADLAALAGAQHLADGSACRWAREAASRNTANLSECRPSATDVVVSVAVLVRLPFWPVSTTASIGASARAGPTTVAATDAATGAQASTPR